LQYYKLIAPVVDCVYNLM